MSAFECLAADDRLSARQRAELDHHRGKALLRLGNRVAAITCFEAVLEGPFPLNEARLQLVKLLAKDGGRSKEAEPMTRALLEGFGQPGGATNSVFMAVVEMLPWGNEPWRHELIAKYGSVIEETLVRLCKLGISQAYRTFASIGRYWARTDDPAFLRVFDVVPPREPDDADEDDDVFAYGELLHEASRIKASDRSELQARALASYEALHVRSKYQTQRLAELLIDLGRHKEAVVHLEALPEIERDSFGQYRLSRAYFGVGRLAEAQNAIQNALSLLTKDAFRQEFEAHSAQVEAAMVAKNSEDNDPTSVTDASTHLNVIHGTVAPP